MVKRLILGLMTVLIFSSCAFFGASVFPVATSVDISWFRTKGDISHFYILDNGKDEPLLFLVSGDYFNGNVRVLIFDTALNIRGFLSPFAPDETKVPTITDGIGFTDGSGNFVVGQTVLPANGTTSFENLSFLGVHGPGENLAVIPYSDANLGNVYICIRRPAFHSFDVSDPIGDLELAWDIYDETFTTIHGTGTLPWIQGYMLIHQANPSLEDIMIGTKYGEGFYIGYKALVDHATGLKTLAQGDITSIQAGNSDFTQWGTRCKQGYFVSTQNGEFVLINGTDGTEAKRFSIDDNHGNIVTIDYEGEYVYMLVDKDKTYIKKERVRL